MSLSILRIAGIAVGTMLFIAISSTTFAASCPSGWQTAGSDMCKGKNVWTQKEANKQDPCGAGYTCCKRKIGKGHFVSSSFSSTDAYKCKAK